MDATIKYSFTDRCFDIRITTQCQSESNWNLGYNLAIVSEMLCSKFKHFGITKSTLPNNIQFRCITSRIILKKWGWVDEFLTSVSKKENNIMSPLRIILKDLRVWSGWTRSGIVNTVVRRCRRDRGVREVIQCFRQAFFRPRRTLLISATAAYKARGDDDDSTPSCEKSISDVELQVKISQINFINNVLTFFKFIFSDQSWSLSLDNLLLYNVYLLSIYSIFSYINLCKCSIDWKKHMSKAYRIFQGQDININKEWRQRKFNSVYFCFLCVFDIMTFTASKQR